MPYAIHLFFDKYTDLAIRAIWQEMADCGVAPYLGTSGNKPHISLVLCDELDPGECAKKLKTFAEQFKPMPISFQTLGIFPGPTVFTGPVVTRELLDLQCEVDGLLDGCCKWPESIITTPAKGSRIARWPWSLKDRVWTRSSRSHLI